MTLEVRQYRGLWWLPSKPNHKIYGTLSYDRGKYPILSLDGAFVKHLEEGGEFYEIILGISENKKLTLVNCLSFHISHSFSGSGDFSRSKFQVQMFCVGNHYPKKNALQFTEMDIKYSHLKAWLSANIFRFSDTKHTKTELILTIKKPLEKEIALSEFTLKIRGLLEGSSGFFHDSYRREAMISIYSEKAHLKKFFRIINDVRNFLCLAIGERISIQEILADRIQEEKIELVIPDLMGEGTTENKISFYPLPIEFSMISKNLDFYFKNWFSFIKEYEPVYQLFFAAIEKLYSMTQFLNLSQAIEAYHSRKYDDRLFSDEVLKEIDNSTKFSEKIVEPLEPRSKDSFKKKFSFVNRKSLRMRIKELFGDFGKIFKIFIKDEKKFISIFVDARNYYTHYDPEIKKPLKQDKIPFLIDDLRLILLTVILTEMGFNQAQTQRIVTLYCRTKIQKTFSFF